MSLTTQICTFYSTWTEPQDPYCQGTQTQIFERQINSQRNANSYKNSAKKKIIGTYLLRIIFRHCYRFPWKIILRFFFCKLWPIKNQISQNREKYELCTYVKQVSTDFSQIPHHVECRIPYTSPFSNHLQTICSLLGIHHSEPLANLCHL